MHQALVDSVKASMVLLPAVVDGTTALSKFVDTIEHDFIEFHIMLGDIAATSTVNAKAQESVNANGGTASDITGAAITQVGGTGDNRMVVISVPKAVLTKRYVGVLVTVGVSTAAVAIEAFRWRKSGQLPESQEAAGANAYGTEEVVRVS
jgi:hypothetical protein